ncbi:acyl-CoA thioesterase [Bacteriovorax sp. Seq25_V]|uniref:acyl-CoA thioesterase n=1 Tax=Bacteriovorax sp. Seq25_V TaxID=1201288 RepID=UPI00038A5276|nr:acyl-CoA thioesterase [Bacteriovorax sp. Seq25_V]EQC47166.1 thioesterase family protein [Bacteriovorax sp. Seq25_V]
MDLSRRIESSTTKVSKAIFPSTTNHYDTLFGGTALKWMDEVSFITATRFTRQKVVTVSSSKVDFKKPIPGGTIAELIGKVKMVGKSSLVVGVDIYLEDMYNDSRELAVHGEFTFVAIDDDRKPISIETNLP